MQTNPNDPNQTPVEQLLAAEDQLTLPDGPFGFDGDIWVIWQPPNKPIDHEVGIFNGDQIRTVTVRELMVGMYSITGYTLGVHKQFQFLFWNLNQFAQKNPWLNSQALTDHLRALHNAALQFATVRDSESLQTVFADAQDFVNHVIDEAIAVSKVHVSGIPIHSSGE